MDLQQSLFQAILDAPADDAPRLVYADWLEENDQAERGQLIRVQCQLARLPADGPERKKLERQEAALLRGRKAAWKAELPQLRGVRWGEFSRGFVAEAVVQSVYMFHRHARRIVAAIPLEVLRLRRAEALRAVGNSPCVRHLRELHVPNQRLESAAVRELTESRYLGALAVLDLSDNALGDAGCALLAQSTRLPALRVLDLRSNGVRAQGAAALADSATLTRGLTTLRLGHNPGIGGEARRRLRECYGDRVEF